MSGNLKLNSSGGGSVTLTTPSTASNLTLTLPAATSTLLDTTSTQTLTNKTLAASGSNTVEATSGPTSTQLAGMRNKIINGAMMIDQRNAGASMTPTSDAYLVDRWRFQTSQSSKLSFQQNAGSVTPPVGFSNYLGATSLSAYSISSSDLFVIGQQIEGFNIADLAWGTASAKTVTVSFWVRCSLTGTFGGALKNGSANRSYPFTYTVSSANTWEQKTVTVTGDTAGTWATGNGKGVQILFGLGVGSTSSGTAGAWAGADYWSATGAVSVVGTNGATFYITGVQLEKGATATPFENRLYGTELALCQRYYEAQSGGGYWYSVRNDIISRLVLQFIVPKRAAPTVTTSLPANSGNYTNLASALSATTTNADCGSSSLYSSFSTYTASAEL